MDDGADGDGFVALFIGDDKRHLRDAADAHDGGVRLVDDGQAEHGPELAGVGDGEGGAFNVFRLEFLIAGAFAEVGDSALQAEEVEVSGVLEDGDDESPVECDGDPYVNAGVVADVVAFERSVDDRPLLQRNDGGTDKERHEGEADAVALLESAFLLGSQGDDASEIHFVHAMDVSAGTAPLDHALRYDLAHVRHGNEIAGVWGGRRGRAGGCWWLSRCWWGWRLAALSGR